MPQGSNRLAETLLLVAAVATLAVGGWLGFAGLAVALGWWFWTAASRRERWLTGSFLLAAVLLVAFDNLEHHRSSTFSLKREAVERQFRGLWDELDRRAARTATALEGWSEERSGAARAFATLVAEAGGTERWTYLLVDPSGAVRAWAGAGLLHDLEELSLPTSGRSFRLGFQSVTIYSVASVPGEESPGSVVVGTSLSTGDLPARDLRLGPIRWTVFEPGDVIPEELVAIELGVGPRIAVEDWTLPRTDVPGLWESRPRRWGAVALAVALVALAFARERQTRQRPYLLSAAALALTWAARLGPESGAVLIGATLLAAWAWDRETAATGPESWRRTLPWVVGAGGAIAVMALAWWIQSLSTPVDLGSSLLPGLEATSWRLSLFLATLAWLGWVRRIARGAAPNPGAGGWLTMAIALLTLAAALHDLWTGTILTLAILAALLAVRWLVAQGRRRLGIVAGTGVAVVAALMAAVSWEALYQQKLKRYLSSVVLPALAQPSPAEVEQTRQGLERYFANLDLASIVLPNPAGLDPQDLGLALWRDSPLAVRGGLTAVSARPRGAAPSSFSFGLPLTSEGDVDWTPTRWRKVEEPTPEGRVASGSTRLLHGGRPWADVSYTLLMRPGFHLAREPMRGFAAGLLQGGPGPFRPEPQTIAPALYGLYGDRGQPLEPAVAGVSIPLERLVEEPGLRFRAGGQSFVGFGAQDEDGTRVLVLPVLTVTAALERIGTHSVSVLMVVVLLAGIGWICTLRRIPSASSVAALFRSYSKRMLLVTVMLLLVPILLLNTFALRVIGEHLEEEQRSSGESALLGAQRVLGEYILALDPGFGIEAVLDDELVSWLSRVVQHEINLYWGSSVYASSKSELFSAGLLPKRIPGEIFSELALGGARLAARVNQAGGTDYLEIYAPVALPGQDRGGPRLFLSVPLLAQQVETAEELASLRRKILLATAALVLLLLAIGSRLGRGFTEPLMEIVGGTQRIADGASSLDLEPTDTELATLVEAIDRMAERIALGRRRLVREKELVERVIDNVNSGVVSLDREGRVLLLNQVARTLLDAEVGEPLQQTLGRSERLTPVAEFLERSPESPALETVQLPGEEGEESDWSLVWVPLRGEGEPTALFVVEDVTEVLRGQRLQAWAEMARIIAHEIKNPLTPIRLSAEHMRQVHAEQPAEFDRVFERCTSNILEQVRELQQISSEFSAYSRLPKIEQEEGDLAEAVRRVVDGYRASHPNSVRLEVDPTLDGHRVRFDAKLIGRALRNLLENALRASAHDGSVEVRLELESARAVIRVLDRGPGVSSELLSRIFDPYFSTHDSGTGLGLPIARRIAEEHGGGASARNRTGGGLEVELWVPAVAS